MTATVGLLRIMCTTREQRSGNNLREKGASHVMTELAALCDEIFVVGEIFGGLKSFGTAIKRRNSFSHTRPVNGQKRPPR
jgi:hypothetical protein